MFKKTKVKPDIFLSELIVLIEKQLDNGWRFSGCLGLSIERNICINNSRECFFCTDYDLSRENPGYINKGDQFCLFVGDLINNIEIFQYNKFKKIVLYLKMQFFTVRLCECLPLIYWKVL